MISRSELYRTDDAPWDIGRPQRVFVELAEAGRIVGPVLDVGCGTGEHALHFAAGGHEAWGIDLEPGAIDRARAKALQRGLALELRVHDALQLASLGSRFATIVDSGLFHAFDDATRLRYADQIARALQSGGTLFLLCFSELEPLWGGPRRVSEREIRETFEGLSIAAVRPARFERVRSAGEDAAAWIAEVRKP